MTGPTLLAVSERASRLPDWRKRAGLEGAVGVEAHLATGAEGAPVSEGEVDAVVYELLDHLEGRFRPVHEANLAALVRHELWPMLRPMVREAALTLAHARQSKAARVDYVSEKAMEPVAAMLGRVSESVGAQFAWHPLAIKVRDDPLPEAFLPIAATLRDTARRGLVARDVPKVASVFFIHSRSHALTAAPLLAEAKRLGVEARVVARDDNGAFKALDEAGVQYCPFDHFTNSEVLSHARVVRARMKEDEGLFSGPFECDGEDYAPLVQHFARPLREKRVPLLTPLPVVASEYGTMRRIMAESGAKALVVFEEHRSIGKGAVAAARAAGARSLSVQHGNVMENLWFKPFTSDVLAVDGPATRGVLARLGVDERRIVVTGQPRSDVIWKASSNPKEAEARVAQAIGARVRRPLVAVTTQPLPDWSDRERWAKAAVGGISAALPDATIVVKLHPAEDESRYAQWLEGMPAAVTKSLDTYALLAACDLAVTYYSTTGLEAAMMGKPVMALNIWRKKPPVSYRDAGIALEASSEAEAGAVAKSLLTDPAARKSLEESRVKAIASQYRPLDGKASRRVAELLAQMVA